MMVRENLKRGGVICMPKRSRCAVVIVWDSYLSADEMITSLSAALGSGMSRLARPRIFVSRATAAELLGVSLMTVHNWAKGVGGKLNSVKMPGRPSLIPLWEVKRVLGDRG